MSPLPHPEDGLSAFSRVMVFWIYPLIETASKRQLEETDVWNCPDKQSVEFAEKHVWAAWLAERASAAAESPPRSPSIKWALWRAFKSKVREAGFYQVSFLLSQLAQPYLVGLLVQYIATGIGGIGYGIGLAFALAAVSLTSSYSLASSLFLNRRLGVAVRTGCMSIVYSHSLALSSASRMKLTVGTIVSLMSVDSEKLFLAAQFAHFLWHGPVASLIVMALLVPEMGFFSALAGLAWIVALIPLQNYVAKRIGVVRRGMIATTDERVKLTNEILTSIRAIKLYGWELPMMKRVLGERRKELRQLQRYLLNSSYLRELLFAAGPTASLVIFTVHIYAEKESISVAQVFRVLAFINILRFPLNLLGQALKNITDANVSVQRLDKFLLLPVLAPAAFTPSDPNANDAADSTAFISIKDTTFSWEDSGDAKSGSGFLLRISSFHTRNAPGHPPQSPKGELIAIIGRVGAGKSTLFSAILNELPVVPCSDSSTSEVRRVGSVAYCAQSAWIQNLTLKKNVLFGLSDDDPAVVAAYQAAISAAALLPDIAILPNGDETEIGERGITLSGGQKQRVSIARALLAAVTKNASIILLDDPLSAVDSTTAQHIFTHGIVGLCRDKVCMVALNSHLHLLPQFDRVLVMDAGEIVCDGTLAQVWTSDKGREVLKQAGFTELPTVPQAHAQSQPQPAAPPATTPSAVAIAAIDDAAAADDDAAAAVDDVAAAAVDAGPVTSSQSSPNVLIQQETRAKGAVTSALYVKYFSSGFSSVSDLTERTIYTDTVPLSSLLKALYGLFVASVLMLLFAISQFFRIAIDYCLATWARTSAGDPNSLWGVAYYVAFGALVLLLGLRSEWLNIFSIRSASAIHDLVFARILQSPVNTFFDTHTVGEVLNRLARDTEIIDSSVPEFMLQVLINWWQVGTIFALAIWAAPYLVIVLFPLSYGFFRLFRYFASASRDLKRLESVTRSPIYSSLSETLGGLDTIRAYGATERFLLTHRQKMARNLKIYLHLWLCMSWVTARLEIATSVILFAVAMLTVCLRDSADPVSLGLALSYGLQLTALFQRCIQVAIDVSTYMTSVERVLEYQHLESEHSVVPDSVLQDDVASADVKVVSLGPRAAYVSVPAPMPVPASALPADWPSQGAVEFRGVSMRYRENTPIILKGVSFCVKPGERVGIVGRTGSGKSSCLAALFRIVESSGGSILIDGFDTRQVPLAVLRKRIAIIPQDPVLLTGTLRFQLDPLEEHSDAELLAALDSVNLRDLVSSLQQGLHEPIAEAGENLSHGQRQLLCIARALLRNNKILLIDEGTSCVDMETDAIIQQTLRDMSARHNLTVLSIAHRLSTVLDFDKILCLVDGQVKEFGSPAALQARPDSLFSQMVASQSSH